MLEYYKSKMDIAHKFWQEATDTGNNSLAQTLMADYINYKEMYDGALAKS